MHRLDSEGIHLANYFAEEVVPFEDVVSLRRINFLWSIVLEFQVWKPVISKRFMDQSGDPFCLALLETRTERHLIRGGNVDEFIAEARRKIPAYQTFRA
jgi:hypothetical protein